MRLSTEPSLRLLIVVLLCYVEHALAGSTLRFLSLISYSTLPSSDDANSGPIVTDGRFRFGDGVVNEIYVSVNGYISMGTPPPTDSPRIPGDTNIVSPYGADINTVVGGRVRYRRFDHSYVISNFIFREAGDYLNFDSMRGFIIAWDEVALDNGISVANSTFRAILVTDSKVSYVIFNYECGKMGWNGATIGWAYSNTLYATHPLSGRNSSAVGCQYSSSYSAIAYRIDVCNANESTCASRKCIPSYLVCNGVDNCGDNSDEEDCGTDGVNALAIGLAVPFSFIFCCCVTICCVCSLAHCTSKKRRPPRRFATTAVHRATFATSTQATSLFPAPYPTGPTPNTSFATQPTTPYPPHPSERTPNAPYTAPTAPHLTPTAYPTSTPTPAATHFNEPQKEDDKLKEAQFSSGVPPPSYEAATAYPSYSPQALPNTEPPEPSASYLPNAAEGF